MFEGTITSPHPGQEDKKLTRREFLRLGARFGALLGATALPTRLIGEANAAVEKKYILPHIESPTINSKVETGKLMEHLNAWYVAELPKVDAYLEQVRYTEGLSDSEQQAQKQKAKAEITDNIFVAVRDAYVFSMYLHIHEVVGFCATGGTIKNSDGTPLHLNPSLVHQMADVMFAMIGMESYFTPNPKPLNGATGLGQFTRSNGVIDKGLINTKALDEQINIMFAVVLNKIYGTRSLRSLVARLESVAMLQPGDVRGDLRDVAKHYNGSGKKEAYADRAMAISAKIKQVTGGVLLSATQNSYQPGDAAPGLVNSQLMDNFASGIDTMVRNDPNFVHNFVETITEGLSTGLLADWLTNNLKTTASNWSDSREAQMTKPGFKVTFAK